MSHTSITLIVSLGLLLSMLLAVEGGRRLGVWRRSRRSHVEYTGATGLVDGAVFGLLGLLIAFTFSGAVSRFEHRKELVITETNAIGTAYLRLDLLPAEAQPPLRDLFRQYVDARLEIYQNLHQPDAGRSAVARASTLQGQIWSTAVRAVQSANSTSTTTLLLSAVNDMFDIASERMANLRQMHPPRIIFVMLFGLALLTSLLAGYATSGVAGNAGFHVILFAVITTVTVYVTLDIEYPRFGLIRIDSVDQLLVDQRDAMN